MRYGTVESKVRKIVKSRFSFCEYLFMDFSQSNEHLDRVKKPTILYVLPPAGNINLHRDVIKDYPETMIWFLCPTHFDFDGHDNDCKIELMKRLAYQFIYEVNVSGLFEPIEGNIPYQVGYDMFDDNLTGICITPILIEKEGLPLCDGLFTRKDDDPMKDARDKFEEDLQGRLSDPNKRRR